ncbi:hypothetical protein XENOCAPTIV_005342 [Xenoophorus captivus]|uniref:Uncharacterized protein n=1 Tax=Xenoophorus captivus TaxID=1517983 RepID=A0ABV0RTL2_9TELE
MSTLNGFPAPLASSAKQSPRTTCHPDTDAFGERVPQGGSRRGGGSVTPGPVLCSEWWRQEVGIRGAEAAGRSVTVEQIGEVAWGSVMEGFVGEKEDFEINSLGDTEPVELLQNWGDVVTGAGLGEQASSRILYVLGFIEDFG